MSLNKDQALDGLRSSAAAGRLPHAHLITGGAGSGKGELSLDLAGLLLGTRPDAVLAHPDAHFVQPESKSRRIVIDQIRSLEQALHRKPLVGQNKVALIYDADRLQPAAANAFLKTLEEPPQGCFLLLTSSLPEALLETIVSRCVQTSLHGTRAAPSAEAITLIDEFARAVVDKRGSVAAAFQLTRKIQEILVSVRERVTKEYTAKLKGEAKRYKNIEGSEAWMSERENQMKALAEAAALRERDRLLGALMLALGGALRFRHGGSAPHPICEKVAGKLSTQDLLERIDAWEKMRRRLALNVNEALVLEAGMLEIARPPMEQAQ